MRSVIIAVFLALMTNLCSCGGSTADMHGRIHSRFYTMPSYTAQCEMTVYSNKTENKYEFVCTYDGTANRYRVDYPDISVILSENDVRIIRDDSIVNVPSDEGHMLMFVNTFFESYYAGESTALSVSGGDNSGYTELEAELMHPTAFGHRMKLWIDNKTVLPHNMIVYDKTGRQTLAVRFNSFEIRKSVEEKFVQ